MAVKLYDKETVKANPKPVYVKHVAVDGGYTAYAVGSNGSDIASLYTFDGHGLTRHERARQSITRAGHDTTFTQWDDRGRIHLED